MLYRMNNLLPLRRLSGDIMGRSFYKDILRSMKKDWKRFLSILIITALGVGMMTGLFAASMDMYYSANRFFDRQNLFDIRILSTLGLTQEDVDILACIDGIGVVEGGYIETVYTDINGERRNADMTVLSCRGINMPQLLDGTLPRRANEVAVTQKYLDESGKSLGDTITIKEDIEEENSEKNTLIKNDTDQSGSFNTNIDFDMDFELEETETPTFANTDYTITGVVLDSKDIRGDENAGIVFRSTVTADYSFFITEEAASSNIFTVVYIILSGTKEMNSYSNEYKETVQFVINYIESHIKIQQEKARYNAVMAEMLVKIAEAENTMNENFAKANQKFADAWQDIYAAKQELVDSESALIDLPKDADKKIVEAHEKLEKAKRDLADVEAELIEKEQEYIEKKEKAQQKLADAYNELDEIDMTRWYVQDRTSLDSYSSLNNDLSSIKAVGRLFPILFLLVAVLMSLTAMTRMVEEERSLIGIYKALGFGNAAIYSKYILFAFIACLLGGILGDVFGFVFMPRFVSVILASLYSLPQYYLRFDPLYGVGSFVLFMFAILSATIISCRNELKQMPAALLRPKAPRSGSRVWLERIPVIWNRLQFLNKVTVRNLFRYKKRLFMTVGGIMGCTALIVCGFAIRDSVMKLSPNQYEYIYQYDLIAVFEEKDFDDMIQQLTHDNEVDKYLSLRVENVKLFNTDGESSSVQLMVIPNGSLLEEYIHMESPSGKPVNMDDSGAFITENATRILGFKTGDTISLQNLKLEQSEASVSGIVKNYLGNNVYMTQKFYESLFGMYEANGILAHLSDACINQAAYAEALLDNDSVLSAVSTAALREEFALELLNSIVLLLIVLAGGLAFVVLFTLSTTNISERIRELATIKVLGFYDKEVYQYVNKETLVLTAIGVLLGLPSGWVLSGLLIASLNMPSIHFIVYITPVSYLFSAAIAIGFAIIVNWMTNRTLDRINMVEALKSID